MILEEQFSVQLKGEERHLNITEIVQDIVSTWGLENVSIDVLIQHTTCALILQEDEPCLIDDLFAFLDRVIPVDGEYSHDSDARTKNLDSDRVERINGHSHLRATLLNPSFSLQLYIGEEGKLLLSQWQEILFFDFDDKGVWKERTIVIRREVSTPRINRFAEPAGYGLGKTGDAKVP